ncbi:MAG: nickel/cobalt transporter [Parvibaculaceae bacterium]
MIRALLSLLLLSMVVLSISHASVAQTADAPKIDRSKLLVQPRGERGQSTVNLFEHPVMWVQEKQSIFYGAMRQSLNQIRAESSLAAAMTLMLLSFGYGIFHAAGPGHGKAVISAWLIATRNDLRRGILVAFMSAFIQALTAVTVVTAALFLVSAAGTAARDVTGFLESASYLLIALMGAYLIWTAFRPAHAHGSEAHAGLDHHAHDHHAHDHDHADHSHDHEHHHHAHDETCGCGHAHLPSAADVRGEWSLTKASSLAFAVGIRPCLGAILVLLATYPLGIYWAGVTSTFVMAVGTAITVSIIAALTVYSKKIAMRLAERDSGWIDAAAFAARICAGIVIVGLGGLMFWGSLGTTNTMM